MDFTTKIPQQKLSTEDCDVPKENYKCAAGGSVSRSDALKLVHTECYGPGWPPLGGGYFLPPMLPPPGIIPTYPKTVTPTGDAVNHPKHYTSHPSGVECIQITECYDFCVGNAIKYLWRAGLKQDADKEPVNKEIEDCEKAIWYIKRHITNLKKKQST